VLDIWHTWVRREIQSGIWQENFKERDYLYVLGIEGRIILNGFLNILVE